MAIGPINGAPVMRFLCRHPQILKVSKIDKAGWHTDFIFILYLDYDEMKQIILKCEQCRNIYLIDVPYASRGRYIL